MNPIRRALLSVSDKTGLVAFAEGLRALGVEIVSTGGTARALREAGVDIVAIDDFTGFPEMLGGRVKTLHPRVHGGILFDRSLDEHRRTMEEHGLGAIDLVAVNLYPFEATVARPDVTYEDAVEQIDIGGPAMTRSAAKNHAHVTVVVAPDQYEEVLAEMRTSGGSTSVELRRRFALRAFERTAAYDRAIVEHFSAELAENAEMDRLPRELPARWATRLPRARELRYGENPHQKAAVYGAVLEPFRQVHGKELSYNNILDLAAAEELVETLAPRGPAVSIIKHSNPCGAAVAETLADAWRDALATDPVSASGGIIGASVEVDADAARAMADHFIEVLVAPSFTADALEILRKKKNRILLECPRPVFGREWIQARTLPGGVLAQTTDGGAEPEFKVVTERTPTASELEELAFAWDVVRFVKSNAILYSRDTRTLGVGAGQMSRVDSARIAAMKARDAGLDLAGSVVASDAFFPFADGLIACAEAGARAVVQPGGSVRDKEAIAAANERGVAMVFTGRRHFRH